MYTPLALNDGTLVSSDRLKAMSMVTTATQRDATLLVPTRFGPGFMKSMDNRGLNVGPGTSVIMGEQAFGHVGAGGSIGFADPDIGLGFAYAPNHMFSGKGISPRLQALVDTVYAAFE